MDPYKKIVTTHMNGLTFIVRAKGGFESSRFSTGADFFRWAHKPLTDLIDHTGYQIATHRFAPLFSCLRKSLFPPTHALNPAYLFLHPNHFKSTPLGDGIEKAKSKTPSKKESGEEGKQDEHGEMFELDRKLLQ